MAELRQVAGGRPDLLAAHAGLALGLAEADRLGRPATGRRLNSHNLPEPTRRRSSAGSKSHGSELNRRD